MKRTFLIIAVTAVFCLMAGCVGTNDGSPSQEAPKENTPAYSFGLGQTAGQPSNSSSLPQPTQTQPLNTAANTPALTASSGSIPSSSSMGEQNENGEISNETAFDIALENAGVPREDAYNIKIQRDRENDIPIYQIEFETQYGDYDFEIAVSGGKIIGADYEVDEEWLNRLGGSSVSIAQAKRIIAEKVPGSSENDVHLWQASGDGRGRYEGELFYDNIKYEFEMDPATGIIFDWNADLRE